MLWFFADEIGIAFENISAYPLDLTRQLVVNFLHDGATIYISSTPHIMGPQVIDAGINHLFALPHAPMPDVLIAGNASSRFVAALPILRA